MDEAQDPHNTRDMGHCSMSDHQQNTVEIEQGEVVMVIGSPSLLALASPFRHPGSPYQAACTSRAELRLPLLQAPKEAFADQGPGGAGKGAKRAFALPW